MARSSAVVGRHGMPDRRYCLGDRRLDDEIAGVDQHGVLGLDERRGAAALVAGVAGADVGEDIVISDMRSHPLHLLEAAPGADIGPGGDEQFGVGLWSDDRADVAPVEHRAASRR